MQVEGMLTDAITGPKRGDLEGENDQGLQEANVFVHARG